MLRQSVINKQIILCIILSLIIEYQLKIYQEKLSSPMKYEAF